MLNQSWFRNQNNVVCCRKEEVLPKLARELAIPDLSQRVEEFQKTPTAEGVNISGRKRTTLKLLIPNLTFSEPIDMGENVWIYMGELCPAYCCICRRRTVKKRNEADEGKVIGALAILVILAAAFWYGGNAPGLQGWTVGVRESSPVLESIQPSQTPEETGKDAIAQSRRRRQGLWKQVVAVVVAVVQQRIIIQSR